MCLTEDESKILEIVMAKNDELLFVQTNVNTMKSAGTPICTLKEYTITQTRIY